MGKSNETKGQVIESLPNQLFRVQTNDGTLYMCYLSGNMRFHNVKILVGDHVRFLIDPHGGKTTNRIIRRV